MSAQRVINFTFLLFTILIVIIFIIGFLMGPVEPAATTPTPPTPITRLTDEPGAAVGPTWSPNNRYVAFESDREGHSHIDLMDANGLNQRALTSGSKDDHHPAWTSEGKSILYDSSDGIHQEIWMVNIADGSCKQLTHVDGLAEYAAASPDGEHIAFYVYKGMMLNLWSARIDGSDAKPLTRDLADARRNEPTMAWGKPAWSADSQWLAYTGGDGKSIWLMHADGSGAREIINDGETNHFPWFLSDGRLAFITEYVPPKYDAAWTNLWSYDLKTGRRKLLQEHMSMQEPVAWNADLTKLLFTSPRHGNFEIYLIDLSAPGGLGALRVDPIPGDLAKSQ